MASSYTERKGNFRRLFLVFKLGFKREELFLWPVLGNKKEQKQER